jgi:hypothetical protein
MNKSILAISALVLFFAACKKEDKEESKADMLTANQWRLVLNTSIVTYSGSTDTIDQMVGAPACRLDDLTRFLGNGTFQFDEGLTKCNAGDPQSKAGGTWLLSNNDTKLNMVYTSPTDTSSIGWSVEELTGTTITVKHDTVTSFMGQPVYTTNKLGYIKN